MTSILRKSITATAALLGLALSAQSNATLIMKVDGSTVASSSTNTTISFSGSTADFIWTNFIFGTDISNKLIDAGSGEVSSTGAGSIHVLLIETGLLGTGAMSFDTQFTAPVFQGLSVTRSFWFDPTNTGVASGTSLGSITGQNGSFDTMVTNTGMYALVEAIDITSPTVRGTLSSDDSVRVPEPMSLGLVGLGLAAVGLMRRRKAR